ncbi:SHC-transforming protein 3 isoform X1 [Ixodes scapularis]
MLDSSTSHIGGQGEAQSYEEDGRTVWRDFGGSLDWSVACVEDGACVVRVVRLSVLALVSVLFFSLVPAAFPRRSPPRRAAPAALADCCGPPTSAASRTFRKPSAASRLIVPAEKPRLHSASPARGSLPAPASAPATTGGGASSALARATAAPRDHADARAPAFVRHLEANLRRKEDPSQHSRAGADDDAATGTAGSERYTRLPQGSSSTVAPPVPAPVSATSNASARILPSSLPPAPPPPVPSSVPASVLLSSEPAAVRTPPVRRMATAASWGQVATPAPRHQHHQQAQQQQQEPCHHQLPQGFVSRPPRGWLHTDQEVLGLGVTYRVRYIGCLDVKMSMKCLDFDTRSLIAKECITRVCEAAGLKAVDKKRKVDRRLQRMLAERPNMDYAGSNVNLCVTSSSLKLSILETGQAIADHNMPNISFASGGDAETLDFVAYVAKDGQGARACLVLECGGGLAQDVITTIGQAFELRFREFMRGVPAPPPLPSLVPRRPTESMAAPPRDDPEYYNDLPGKMPPEAPPPPVPPLPDYRNEVPEELSKDVVAPLGTTGVKEVVPGTAPQPNARRVSRDTNLIDLSGEELPPAALTPRHEYVNMGQDSGRTRNGVLDPFDMHPFVSGLPLPPPRNLSPFTETTAAASATAPAVAPRANDGRRRDDGCHDDDTRSTASCDLGERGLVPRRHQPQGERRAAGGRRRLPRSRVPGEPGTVCPDGDAGQRTQAPATGGSRRRGSHQRQNFRQREPSGELPPGQCAAHYFGRECPRTQKPRAPTALNGTPAHRPPNELHMDTFDAKIQTLHTWRCKGSKCHHRRRKSAARCHRELLRLTTAGVYTGMCCVVVAKVAGKTEARFKPQKTICSVCQECSREMGAKGGDSAPGKKENTSPPWVNGEAGVLGARKRAESVAKTPRHCGVAISTKCSNNLNKDGLAALSRCPNKKTLAES